MYASADPVSDRCELVERSSVANRNPVRYSGIRDDYGCWVTLSHAGYEERFEFCYLAGFNLHNVEERQAAECFVQRRDEDYVFLAHIPSENGRDGQVMCYFACIGSASVGVP